MISITKHTDYAIVILAHFSKEPKARVSAMGLAKNLKLPYPTVSKLLKILVKSGILESTQGSQGGYVLRKPSEEISIASIVEAVEGPIAMTECSSGHTGQCRTETWCSIKPHWTLINQVIKKSLENLPLSALVNPVAYQNVPDASFDEMWKSLFKKTKELKQIQS